MENILYILLSIFMIFCTGRSAANEEHIPEQRDEAQYSNYSEPETPTPNNPNTMFLNSLISEGGDYIYPDNYGGVYVEYDENGVEYYIFAVVGDDYSDYQYLKDAFPDTQFRSVEYSFNYLCEVRDEYVENAMETSETFYTAGIDVFRNRVVVTTDENTLASKTQDENSLIIFELGSPITLL